MKRWLATLTAVLVPTALCAQDTQRTWPGLNPSGLSTVYVRDDAGAETMGRLLRLDADSLVLLVNGTERRFEAARVRRIEKRGDSLRNGAIIGAIVGVGMGLISAGISDCPGDDPGGDCPVFRATMPVLSAGIYSAIGVGIDALVVGRTTLYVASGSSTARDRPGKPEHRLQAAALNFNVSW